MSIYEVQKKEKKNKKQKQNVLNSYISKTERSVAQEEEGWKEDGRKE